MFMKENSDKKNFTVIGDFNIDLNFKSQKHDKLERLVIFLICQI